MNNMANMANMNPMGGPVGAPMPMMNNSGALPPQGGQRHQANDSNRTLLNTYIYEYFIRNGMYDCARQVIQYDPNINVKKDSPGGRRDEGGNIVGNGLGDDPMDTDTKDGLDQKRPDDLPAPNVPNLLPDSCFLYEWFCLFWDVFNSQKGKGSSNQVNQYVQHTQQQSRLRQEAQQTMLRNIRPPEAFAAQQQYQQHMMRGMQNGAMNMNMKPGNPLQRAAMANNNPQMQMLQQKAAGQMQRDPSDMDGSRVRPASPGSNDNAPSPSKRPRLDGGAPFPGQVMMPNGRPAQVMPGQQQVGNGPDTARAMFFHNGISLNPASLNPDHLQAFVSATPNLQAKNIASYSANLQQHHGNQMPNKPMANAGGPQPQGSPMVQQGPNGAALEQFYNPGDIAPNMRPGPGAQATGSNHALQDYQMQLMLLEQQNKKRLMMARQEQDITGGSMQRPDGPGGPGGPGAPPGPGGQNFQGTSPPGGRNGASPNPSEQMKRGSQQMGNAANMGSPLPDGSVQSRSSPSSMNFMGGGNMDPNGGGPQFFKNDGMHMNMAGQINGNMRPPSSHPGQPFSGQMTQQQQQMMQARAQQQAAQQQAAGQGGPGMQWQQNGPNGQMPGQGPQPQVQGTPQQRAMPPPPSAPAAATAAANSRNTTSSPQTSTAAPPTPQQGNKPAPKKKDTKNAKSKAATQKKAGPNLNAGTTPAAEADPPQETPTPATPITPINPQSFGKNQNVNAAQAVPNGQPAASAPPQAVAPVAAQTHTDPNRGPNFMDPAGPLVSSVWNTRASASTNPPQDFSMDFANPLTSGDVLTDFDFDSFLHDTNGGEDAGFGFDPGAFSMEGGEIGAE
ncbi:hypothetical protein B0H67DRAFT_345468 [Lasiosphaeris hirsuta]|uniref:LisH domain-containing protein n=1 Tax=Lasiosphaeris hirsuta TaxID=260670 RepID=A0AA40A3J8_9PEZI|nr:hypothetical protein B0H67DRAFT_345468 [Lasiosphaeris hirsuta]